MTIDPILWHCRSATGMLALCAICVLSACGGSDSPHVAAPPATPPIGSAPPAPPDAFFSFVASRSGNLSESDEPATIDGTAETVPETTEPDPVN